MEKKLRAKIAKVLKAVKPNINPTIYEFIQVKTGYKRVENMMIEMMINDNMSASATIPHIEKML